jgi:hypothetical protein
MIVLLGSGTAVSAAASVFRAGHEFVEAAGFAGFRFFLEKEDELVLIEDREEVVPCDFLQGFFRLPEIDAQNAAFLAPFTRAGWPPRSSIHCRISL